jgi:acyl-coenzyme A synthetase/AMP-(fatty) acid ligase
MLSINQIISENSHNNSELSDGRNYCSYAEIHKIFKSIDTQLSFKKITKKDYLILITENTLKSAIVLLYLLAKNYSFFLIPNLNNSILCPSFCQYKLQVDSDLQKDQQHISDISLNWTINNYWNGKKADPANPQLYMQTSGSTGKPKLLAHSHPKLLQNALNCQKRLDLKSSDRISIPVPIYHLYGLGAAFLPAIIAGASVDLQANANPLRYLDREKAFKPNIALITPTFAQTLLKVRKSARLYRFTVMAGDRIPANIFDLYEQKFGTVVPLYGSSEMGVIAIANSTESKKIRQNTVGKPLVGVEIKLEEKETSQLWCRHQYGFEGYVDYQGNWLEQVGKNWFPTKDLAAIISQTYLKILGRSDFCVNRDGLLVLLTDIDKAIESISGVEKAVTVTKGENIRGKEIKTYCVLEKNTKLTDKEIRNICFDLLPRRAVPDEVIIVSHLPLLSNGKINRQALIKDLS